MRILFRLLAAAVASLVIVLSAALAQGAGKSNPGLERAREVHASQAAGLFNNPRVMATGVGVNPAGRPVIKVYLESGKGAGVPAAIDGVKIETTVSGPIVARLADDRYDRPTPIGVSTGHTNITAGTIGCRVQIGCHAYALSNNHVFADEGAAAIGDDILQPGPIDGGQSPADIIGTLHDFEPISFSFLASNEMDAAVMATDISMLDQATLGDGYGLPRTQSIDAFPTMTVMKYGRTTELTSGEVDAIDATVLVDYTDNGLARFVGQIIIKPGNFSSGGDSGSLIVVEGGLDERRPVGLLFAGSPTITIANPIQPVLDRFGATIQGDPN